MKVVCMSEYSLESVREKIEGTERMAKIAWNLHRYIAGKKDPDDLVSVADGRMTVAGGYDTIPMRTDSFGEVLRSIFEFEGPAGIFAIREAYRENGRSDARGAKQLFSVERIGSFFQFWLDCGYADIVKTELRVDGKMETIPLEDMGSRLPEADQMVTTITNSFTVRAARESDLHPDYPICIFGPAYAAGAIETWLDVDVELTEETCQGKGDEHCRWVFTLDPDPEQE